LSHPSKNHQKSVIASHHLFPKQQLALIDQKSNR